MLLFCLCVCVLFVCLFVIVILFLRLFWFTVVFSFSRGYLRPAVPVAFGMRSLEVHGAAAGHARVRAAAAGTQQPHGRHAAWSSRFGDVKAGGQCLDLVPLYLGGPSFWGF